MDLSNLRKSVKSITDDKGVDVAFESVGGDYLKGTIEWLVFIISVFVMSHVYDVMKVHVNVSFLIDNTPINNLIYSDLSAIKTIFIYDLLTCSCRPGPLLASAVIQQGRRLILLLAAGVFRGPCMNFI